MKKPFHEEISERIIEQLNQGTAPWQKPWNTGDAPSRPYNVVTGKEYRGGNYLNLSMSNFSDPRWLTFKQAKDMGYKVKKGSKGTAIQVYKFPEKEEEKEKEKTKENLDEQRSRPIIRTFTVFNAEQIEGIPELEPRVLNSWEVIEKAEKIIQGSKAEIQNKMGDVAYYSPASDKIVLPLKDQFPNAENYYATALHELGHWTGHESRLDRPLIGKFGSPEYAKEELRAEIASMMLSQSIGISHDPNQHISYVASWVQVLENDPLEIMRASRDAEKIHDYILELEIDIEKNSDSLKNEFDMKIKYLPENERKEIETLEKGMLLTVEHLPSEIKDQAKLNFYQNQVESINSVISKTEKQPEIDSQQDNELEI